MKLVFATLCLLVFHADAMVARMGGRVGGSCERGEYFVPTDCNQFKTSNDCFEYSYDNADSINYVPGNYECLDAIPVSYKFMWLRKNWAHFLPFSRNAFATELDIRTTLSW